MSTNQNDQSGFTQKNLFNNKDYTFPGSTDFMHEKPCNPYHLLMLENKTYSFIVEWQMPALGDYYAELPESLNSD